MNGSVSKFARIRKNGERVDLSLTIEDVAKVRRFGESVDDGVVFILARGLTNLSFGPGGLTNLNGETQHE